LQDSIEEEAHMVNDPMLAAVKAGMKGELDSITVYEGAAAQSEGEVREFFKERAEEEKKHYNYLLGYYKKMTTNLNPERNAAAELSGGDWRSSIMSEAFYRRIAGSRQLTAAVSAAALLEMNAIRHYRECAENATELALKDFFGVLVEWEERHYHDLIKIQEESERYYWDINNFEPF
jgi:rubrerythrin